MLIKHEVAMRQLGADLIGVCESGGVIALRGDLGAGKTTLVRGALESLGVTSGVRSPTYTLIEYYEFTPLCIAHFDLYRLADGEELEYLGYRDYLNATTICFIEWPERAEGYLSNIGLEINIEYDVEGRQLEFKPANDWGSRISSAMNL
jgi:tRNA threonylcarbamoyladenosine biosynthesis protein TsaE